MSGSYRQCVECGKRALKIATRCPGCGIELPSPAPLEIGGISKLNRFLSLNSVMAVSAAGVILASLVRGPASPPPLNAETSFLTVEASPAAMPRPDTTSVAALAMGPAGVPLIAKGWTNVRSRRTVNATLEAVLTPGDTVFADSLANGWYRVALYGEVLGYARQTTLSPTQP